MGKGAWREGHRRRRREGSGRCASSEEEGSVEWKRQRRWGGWRAEGELDEGRGNGRVESGKAELKKCGKRKPCFCIGIMRTNGFCLANKIRNKKYVLPDCQDFCGRPTTKTCENNEKYEKNLFLK